MRSPSYLVMPSRFGEIAVVWGEADFGPLVLHVFVPRDGGTARGAVLRELAGAKEDRCAPVVELAERIQSFFEGEDIVFGLSGIDLGSCTPFQRKVLIAEHQIPRGWVSTYGRIAKKLGKPSGARAVGAALASNPFPIIIPCHRAVKSDGTLGGYQGGLHMKRALLESEGIEFSPSGKVVGNRIYY